MKRHLLAVSLSLLLNACGGDSPIAVMPLCLNDACGQVVDLVTVPDAENTLVTPQGRLFVSGGTGVFELTRASDGSYAAQAISPATCNFTGLALRGDVLYAACFDGTLHAARLTATPRLQVIHDTGLSAANGLAMGPEGELYLVNGPLVSDPRVLRLRLSASDPFQVTEQIDWLTTDLLGPNGVAVDGRMLYLTDNTSTPPAGRVQAVRIASDGSPGERRTLATFTDVLDDLSVHGDSLLVARYAGGQVTELGLDGTIRQETGPQGLSFPSSVRAASSPLLQPGDVLITQKGIIGDNVTPVGNRLSVLRPNGT